MSSDVYDLLIVGQGLSGTALAFEALQKNLSVIVVDHAGLSLSSRIAPGIFNPVVFKRLTPSWNASIFIPFLKSHFQLFEKQFGVQLMHLKPVLKLMNEEEKNFWLKKASAEMKLWLSDSIHTLTSIEKAIFDESLVAYAEVKESGWIDLKIYLEQMRGYLKQRHCLVEQEWSSALLTNHSSHFEYGGIKFKRMVFCEGHRAMHNPFFPEIKFKPVKGDVFEVKLPLQSQPGIWNKELFLQEISNGLFRTGSTYQWDFQTTLPEDEMKSVFLSKWSKVFKIPFQPLSHTAAIRPSSIDRRPFLGESKLCKNAFILNGMGTKGVMMAPYLANHLLSHIFEGKELIPEVDIRRFRNE